MGHLYIFRKVRQLDFLFGLLSVKIRERVARIQVTSFEEVLIEACRVKAMTKEIMVRKLEQIGLQRSAKPTRPQQ